MYLPTYRPFTIASDDLIKRLITNVSVGEAFDPNNPPKNRPKMKTVQGLWDTGATSSCVSNEVANDLGLIVRGSAEVQHAGGSSLLNTYIVNILLPNNVGFSGVPVMEADIHRQGFDMIIGMDIITQGDFALTNKDGHSRFSFRTPSTETIDYVKQHDQSIVSNLGRNDPCFCGSGKKFKDCHLWELEKRISGL